MNTILPGKWKCRRCWLVVLCIYLGKSSKEVVIYFLFSSCPLWQHEFVSLHAMQELIFLCIAGVVFIVLLTVFISYVCFAHIYFYSCHNICWRFALWLTSPSLKPKILTVFSFVSFALSFIFSYRMITKIQVKSSFATILWTEAMGNIDCSSYYGAIPVTCKCISKYLLSKSTAKLLSLGESIFLFICYFVVLGPCRILIMFSVPMMRYSLQDQNPI